jgi:YspA, cpYpsA-related SLOG family
MADFGLNRCAVLVTGSRRLVHGHAAIIRSALAKYEPMRGSVVVLHGGAKGADRIADLVAKELFYSTWAVPYFEPLGLGGGPVRNRCLVDLLGVLKTYGYQTHVEAFPDAESKGTWDCVEYAKSKGHEATVHKC